MRNLRRIATVCGLAAACTLAFGTSADATTYYASCSTTGAKGSMGADYPSGDLWEYDTFKIAMSVTDTAADGHHVQIRFLSKEVGNSGTVKWPWHSFTSANGDTFTFSTTAQDDYGIVATGVEVARYEGSTYLNSCTDWS
ncbi:MAG: hypothetical protein JF597_34130 [Streptomyces sp.]|uniref:hypothetical protein n=1 Tax=Streptomyces sp. TaxID=1931 RepID=UPI0025D67CA5|nr:hypothetical protein [Streptomyces sp.]MBW8798437.1 hypothetical protein [Streptomyces sp.]